MKTPSIAPDVRVLLDMLTYMRPARSVAEEEFIARFVKPLGTSSDEYGNEWLTLGDDPSILWSCHTDTVHKEAGRQSVEYGDNLVTAPSSSCLGADCGVGVWIMSEMIKAGVPGVYIFHRDEEIGGYGSDYIARNFPDVLRTLSYAIAFDRKGRTEIITHQMRGRCASDEFALSLAECLRPLDLSPSDGGTFTDTANYSDLIPECTNLSVGYFNQHQPIESLYVPHAVALRDAILAADFAQLVCEREAGSEDTPENWAEAPWQSRASRGPAMDAFTTLIADYPDRAAALMESMGITQRDLEAFIDRDYWDIRDN